MQVYTSTVCRTCLCTLAQLVLKVVVPASFEWAVFGIGSFVCFNDCFVTAESALIPVLTLAVYEVITHYL